MVTYTVGYIERWPTAAGVLKHDTSWEQVIWWTEFYILMLTAVAVFVAHMQLVEREFLLCYRHNVRFYCSRYCLLTQRVIICPGNSHISMVYVNSFNSVYRLRRVSVVSILRPPILRQGGTSCRAKWNKGQYTGICTRIKQVAFSVK